MNYLIVLFSLLLSMVNTNLVYSQTYIITNVDYNSDIVEIQDCNGFTYEFYGTEDYCEGDLVSCIMWTNNTNEIFDDEIISVRYSGIAEWYIEIYPNY